MNKTEQHRKIYPLPMDQISKRSSFEQILGKTQSDYTETERKARWEKTCSFSGGQKVKEFYGAQSECAGCKNRDGDWCNFASLPCGVNPILTYQEGYAGLACKGVGFELIEKKNN